MQIISRKTIDNCAQDRSFPGLVLYFLTVTAIHLLSNLNATFIYHFHTIMCFYLPSVVDDLEFNCWLQGCFVCHLHTRLDFDFCCDLLGDYQQTAGSSFSVFRLNNVAASGWLRWKYWPHTLCLCSDIYLLTSTSLNVSFGIPSRCVASFIARERKTWFCKLYLRHIF